jgi:hypothetical protein
MGVSGGVSKAYMKNGMARPDVGNAYMKFVRENDCMEFGTHRYVIKYIEMGTELHMK